MRRRLPRLVLVSGLCAVVLLTGGCGKSGQEKAADLINQGIAAQSAGNLDTAAADFLEATKEDSKNKFAFYNLGVVYQQQGKMVDAEFAYRSARLKAPGFALAGFHVALLRS
jgi:Flp pilus assembly protein TadD